MTVNDFLKSCGFLYKYFNNYFFFFADKTEEAQKQLNGTEDQQRGNKQTPKMKWKKTHCDSRG